MTDRENEAKLTWTRKNDQFADGASYRAEANGCEYVVFRNHSTHTWTLRGYAEGESVFNRTGKTLAALKSHAAVHASL